MVDRAADAGAEVLTGGDAPDGGGYFYAPSIVVGPAQDSEIVQREVFGPVVTVQRAPDEETLLAWANGVDYGLAASRVDHATSAGPCGWPPGCASAPCGSTTTSRS